MKKKILYSLLVALLLFVSGCGTESSAELTPTPTPSEAPTPTPENLAMTQLNAVQKVVDEALASSGTSETAEGVGFDMTASLEVGKGFASLLGMADFPAISLNGSFDVNKTFAGTLALLIENEKLLQLDMLTDLASVFINLPAYSDSYANIPLELDELADDALAGSASLGDITGSVSGSLSEEEAKAVLTLTSDYLKRLLALCTEVSITENVSVGVAPYSLTGTRHSISANLTEVYNLFVSYAEELKKYPEFTFDIPEADFEPNTVFYVNYYISENGNYAWEFYPQENINEPVIFISSDAGIRLCKITEHGNVDTLLYTEKLTATGGRFYLLNDGVASITADYDITENAFSIATDLDGTSLSLSCTYSDNTAELKLSMDAEGTTITFDCTASDKTFTMALSLGTYDIVLGTVTINGTVRDYREPVMPTNTVDINTWSANLNTAALLEDINELSAKYPYLGTLLEQLLGSDSSEDEDDDYTWEDDYAITPSVDFSWMTGYSVDEDGYVDFEPLEEEVISAGLASTGLDTVALTEEQTSTLIYYPINYLGMEGEYYTYLNISGYPSYNSVYSYYYLCYEYMDANGNSVEFTFDAMSGEFSDVLIFTNTQADALTIASDIMSILGLNYTFTPDENGAIDDSCENFYIYAQPSDSFYYVSISVANWLLEY